LQPTKMLQFQESLGSYHLCPIHRMRSDMTPTISKDTCSLESERSSTWRPFSCHVLRSPASLGLAIGIAMVVTIPSMPVAAQGIHADLCMQGCPIGSPATNDLIIRDIYVLSSNDATKFADWVAYRVTRNTIGPTARRTWRADPWLAASETLEPDDYIGANAALNTDRGHQAPLASFTGTDDWEATNYLSNITPQSSALNQGAWVRLESSVRTLAEEQAGPVYVMTGPLYEREMPSMPGADEPHRVPSGYWKIIAMEENGEIEVAAFLFDQDTPRRADYCEERFVTSVRTIEGKARLNFFPELTPADQDGLETGLATLLTDLGCRP